MTHSKKEKVLPLRRALFPIFRHKTLNNEETAQIKEKYLS
jgi:hypothetical protein